MLKTMFEFQSINSVSKYGNMSETTKCHNPKSTVSYSNPQYLGPSYFEQTGRPYSNILKISWVIVKF